MWGFQFGTRDETEQNYTEQWESQGLSPGWMELALRGTWLPVQCGNGETWIPRVNQSRRTFRTSFTVLQMSDVALSFQHLPYFFFFFNVWMFFMSDSLFRFVWMGTKPSGTDSGKKKTTQGYIVDTGNAAIALLWILRLFSSYSFLWDFWIKKKKRRRGG